MVSRFGRGNARRILAAQISGVATGFCGRFREGLTREAALAEIGQVAGGDGDLLAEVASGFVVSYGLIALPWYAAAVELLVEAGADPQALRRYARHRREHPPSTIPMSMRASPAVVAGWLNELST